MNTIPDQLNNPDGMHLRYRIQKIVKLSEEEIGKQRSIIAHHGGDPEKASQYKLVDVDPQAEYFVLRLDEGGKDINHIKAGRIGINAYADAIEATIPQLAADIRKRYPIIK